MYVLIGSRKKLNHVVTSPYKTMNKHVQWSSVITITWYWARYKTIFVWYQSLILLYLCPSIKNKTLHLLSVRMVVLLGEPHCTCIYIIFIILPILFTRTLTLLWGIISVIAMLDWNIKYLYFVPDRYIINWYTIWRQELFLFLFHKYYYTIYLDN